MSDFSTKIDEFFHITERGSTIRTEVVGGIITFLAMFYILAVNPLLLENATGEEYFGQLMAAAALAACVSCLLMGLYAKTPVSKKWKQSLLENNLAKIEEFIKKNDIF